MSAAAAGRPSRSCPIFRCSRHSTWRGMQGPSKGVERSGSAGCAAGGKPCPARHSMRRPHALSFPSACKWRDVGARARPSSHFDALVGHQLQVPRHRAVAQQDDLQGAVSEPAPFLALKAGWCEARRGGRAQHEHREAAAEAGAGTLPPMAAGPGLRSRLLQGCRRVMNACSATAAPMHPQRSALPGRVVACTACWVQLCPGHCCSRQRTRCREQRQRRSCLPHLPGGAQGVGRGLPKHSLLLSALLSFRKQTAG